MALNFKDHGDKYDKEKWDFNEKNIPIYIINKYPYKARSRKNAEILAMIRDKINILCYNLEINKSKWKNTTTNKEYIEGVNIFLGLHKEYYYDSSTLPKPFYSISKKGQTTSRYLLSEIPKKTPFDGINKPKLRYTDINVPSVGKDGKGRALYKDIFLNLSLSDRNLTKLIIHELAHTMANHISYVEDNHHADFKWCENLIAKYWP
jgi:hypothetical protein